MQDDTSDNRAKLRSIIEAQYKNLLNSLQLYVIRAGIADNQPSEEIAVDLLGEVTEQALRSADRWNESIQPIAWLLGIANNLIKQRRDSSAKNMRREPLAKDLHGQSQLSEDQLFDLLSKNVMPDPAKHYESNERINELLAPLNEIERFFIRETILYGKSIDMIADDLHLSSSTARKRRDRALTRLRGWHRRQDEVYPHE